MYSCDRGLKTGFRRDFSSTAQNCPRKCVFTNHVPQLCLKVNSITRSEFCAWMSAYLHRVKVVKCQGYLSIAYLFYGHFAGRFAFAKHTGKQTAQLFLFLDTQGVENGWLRCARNCTRNLTGITRTGLINYCDCFYRSRIPISRWRTAHLSWGDTSDDRHSHQRSV